MWQKHAGEYHFIMSDRGSHNGRFLRETYCQEQLREDPSRQVPYPRERRCGVCDGVANLINTSVEEAVRYSLPKETRLVVLYRALELKQSVTLKKAIERRIRKVADLQESHSQK
jgi:hypothetical protein